jgi:hypothetical protein
VLLIEHAALGRACWWLSPTYSMAAQVWRDLKAASGTLAVRVSESERRIDLRGGGYMAVRSAHAPDYLRGAGLDFAVLDEMAFMERTVWTQIVRPMLLDRRGSALFLSTPFGRNHFWELFTIGLDAEEPDWSAFHFTSYDNPLIDPAEIDALRRVTPERIFREEYLAQFVEDSGSVFHDVRAAATARPDAVPVSGRRCAAGIDWGRDGDYTAIAVLDTESGAMLALERFRGESWSRLRERLMTLCARWQPSVIWAEANSIGSVNIEALQRDGLPVRPFMTTQRSKAPLIEALALAIERREIALLPDETLLNELAAYALERLQGGGYRYGAPSGLHDDTVIATALAWHGVRHGGAGLAFE